MHSEPAWKSASNGEVRAWRPGKVRPSCVAKAASVLGAAGLKCFQTPQKGRLLYCFMLSLVCIRSNLIVLFIQSGFGDPSYNGPIPRTVDVHFAGFVIPQLCHIYEPALFLNLWMFNDVTFMDRFIKLESGLKDNSRGENKKNVTGLLGGCTWDFLHYCFW